MKKALALQKVYKGLLHPDSLLWCHGSIGLKHDKVRKFRYPFYKYVLVHEVRYIACVCKNCNMTFWGELANGVPLEIPVYCHPTSYISYALPVTVNGSKVYPNKVSVKTTNLGWATQEMIIEDTRRFIDRVQ